MNTAQKIARLREALELSAKVHETAARALRDNGHDTAAFIHGTQAQYDRTAIAETLDDAPTSPATS